MNRRDFIKICQTLGLTLPLQPTRNLFGLDQSQNNNNILPVIIIGAGAAGLSSGYLLQQQGVNFQLLEASSFHGGRMKRTTEFANFPIPLGAEWIHVKPDILEQIVNNDSVNIDIETTKYDPDVDYGMYQGKKITLHQAGFSKDSKFINSTWFDFYDEYIAESIKSRISYNSVVNMIDYSSDIIQVKTQDNIYFAERVIITVPVNILQNGAITFIPELPNVKQNAIDRVRVWSGCKAFIEFTEKFYPVFVEFNITPKYAGQKLYYDAAYGQDTSQHILGLFAVGSGADPYITMSEDRLINHILDELDVLFDSRASQNYVKHIFQNWDAEPYANGAYVIDNENWKVVRNLGNNVDNKLFFAGDAYTDGNDWGSVHAAARSAKTAVKDILDSKNRILR